MSERTPHEQHYPDGGPLVPPPAHREDVPDPPSEDEPVERWDSIEHLAAREAAQAVTAHVVVYGEHASKLGLCIGDLVSMRAMAPTDFGEPEHGISVNEQVADYLAALTTAIAAVRDAETALQKINGDTQPADPPASVPDPVVTRDARA